MNYFSRTLAIVSLTISVINIGITSDNAPNIGGGEQPTNK